MKLKNLAKMHAGEGRLRLWEAKRARAASRQREHSWKLRATSGLSTVLEDLSAHGTTLEDYRKRVMLFLDFIDRHRLPHKSDRDLDLAASD